jgi:K+-transporting ATPase KdpF subunit
MRNGVDNVVGLVVAVVITAYLVYALVFPEKL